MNLAGLAKAVIINTVTNEQFTVMYNPEELKLDQSNIFAEVPIPGLGTPPLQYVRGRGRALAMDLFFDTYETADDVRDYTGRVVALLDKLPETQAPPVLLFSLGPFTFQCVLTDAGQRFTMFLRDGTPVRSVMSVKFQEYVRLQVDVAHGFFALPPTLHNITQGQTLSGLAADYLGDPSLWRQIARANNIVDPLNVPAGTALVIPRGPASTDTLRGADDMSADPYYAPRFEVRISGLTLAVNVTNQILSVTYDNDLDVADMFRIVLRNADNSLLDSSLFDLGKTVEIHMGYGNDLRPMMLGEVTAIEPTFPQGGAPTVQVSGYDRSYKMRHNQPEPTQYRDVNDSVIAALIAAENLLIPIVDPSPIFHRRPIPRTGSDMAFLKERAQANFFETYVWWDKLYFQLPRPQGKAYVLEWGKNLSSYSPRISATGLAGLQVVRGYNEELASTIVGFALAADLDPDTLVERLGSAGLELLMSLGRRVSRVQKLESPVDAMLVAKSLIQEIFEGLYEGSGACVGIPNLRAGSYVQVQGVGKRFSGTYRLRKVVHTIDDGGYRVNFEVTQRGRTNLLGILRKSMQESPPPNKREKFFGVAVAKVTRNAEILDVPPAAPLGRVMVVFPDLSDTIESGWARCLTPMAGSKTGVYFLPEVGDEVLVAFEGGDLSSPVVLGSLWNTKQLPPTTNQDTRNNIRMIKSRSGHTVTLDDTPGLEQVVIADQAGSQIIMKATGDVVISAKNNIELHAQNVKVNVAPSGSMDVT